MLLSPTAPALSGGGWTVQSYDLGPIGLGLFFITWEKLRIATFSRDSGLEAFSHNPTHGSFAALAVQPTANTNYVNPQFLSYYVGLLWR